MLVICLFIIPFTAVFIACCTAWLCCFWLQRKYRVLTQDKPLKLIIEPPVDQATMWKEGLFDRDLEVLIGRRLDAMVVAVKTQIPMIGMLLTQSREDKLKAQAHEEFIKLIPEIKEAVAARYAEQGTGSEGVASIPMMQEPLEKLTAGLWKSWAYAAVGLAALLGLFVGLAELWLISLLCR